MEFISSKTNEKIKYAVKLRDSSSFRKKENAFFIESPRLLKDAFLSGVEIRMLFVTEEAKEKYWDYINEAIKSAQKSFVVTEEVAEKLADTKSTQGVFAVVTMLDKFANISKIKYYGKYVALEEISNPSNFGAICRTAEAVGLNGIIIKGGCDVYNPKALRASMGSLLRMNVIQSDNLCGLIEKANSDGMKTLASVPRHEAEDIRTVSMDGGVVCCVGNEGSGLSEEVIKKCSAQVTIPMSGRAESFNASAAAAILAWELKR